MKNKTITNNQLIQKTYTFLYRTIFNLAINVSLMEYNNIKFNLYTFKLNKNDKTLPAPEILKLLNEILIIFINVFNSKEPKKFLNNYFANFLS